MRYVGLGNLSARLGAQRETYRVKKGDTLWQVSRQTGVGVKELIEANRLRDPDHLEVGQRLRIPRRPAAKSKKASVPARPHRATPKRTAPAANSARAAPKAKLIWPIQERFKIESRFGSHDDGLNRGIDLVAPEGTPVVAACDGVVTNAFLEHDRIGKILGYGNLIFLSHDNGLITLYGYNRDISVNAGDRVKQGEKIAEVGNTGRARAKAGCRLHFEIRDKYEVKKVYDPEKLLPPLR